MIGTEINNFNTLYTKYYRKSILFTKSYVHDEFVAEDIFSAEVQQIIGQTLSILPEQTRRIFEMSRFENKTNKEITNELQLTIKEVEYHIIKALKPLRLSLQDYLPLFYFFFFLNKTVITH